MAAKLLHSLTDDNPELQNQMGCMTGFIQLFDRHHILSGRHISGRSPKRLPSGSSHFSNGTSETGPYSVYHQQTAKEKNSYKNVYEKQRVSTESSRASFSSSRSSSFSSLDCNRTAQPESSSFDQIIFPETPSNEPAMNQSCASPQFGRQSLDLRDVVKDSMYREVQGLSVKSTMKEVAAEHVVKHRDSPRPLQLSKSADGSHSLGTNGKNNLTVDLKESLRVLAKLQEAPWYFSEVKERSRSSCESKDGSLFSIPKDAPRFSYDGREINRLSFESRDVFKKTTNLKELPRLSLDGREGSRRGFNSDLKSNFPLRNTQDSGNTNNWVTSPQQISGSQTRAPSVVAKLMGLDALPGSCLTSDSQLGLINTCPIEDSNPFGRSSKSTGQCRSIPKSKSSRNSWTEPPSPHWKNPDSVVKPVSRFPKEPAPWKQLERSRGSQKPAYSHPKVPGTRATSSYSSVYNEIEKRLKDLEFTQSGKDLRALKQILEAMQAKGLLETRAEEQDPKFGNQRNHELQHMGNDQNVRLVNQQKPQGSLLTTSTNRRNDFSRNYDSPIVIMKPAKLVKKSGIHSSSVIPVDGLSGLPKLRGGDLVDNRKGSINGWTAKDQIPKTSSREIPVNSTDKRTNGKNLKLTQTLTRPQWLPKENTTSSVKRSGSVSPRLQQKKLELEKRSRPPTPLSDSMKSRRQSIKQQPDSGSPSGKRRPKSSKLQQSDDSEISSETRIMGYQEDDLSSHSDSNTLDSKIDIEVSSSDRSAEINGSQSTFVKPAKYSVHSLSQKKSSPRLSEDGPLTEIATVVLEHHSPVSVLDDLVYRDDALSPVKRIPNNLQDDGTHNSNNDSSKEPWVPADNILTNSSGSGLSSKIDRKKLQNIDNLVQKLRSLNSSHDEARTDYIASLCEDTNPDHRYISEILLASGLLLRDLGSSLTTFQLHSSDHPINPELFLVLEQTRGSTSLKEECSAEKVVNLKPDQEKFHRKLIFDYVNEILVGKLALVGTSPEPWLRPNKLARKTLNAQKLLKELCSEIEKLQTNKSECSEDDEEDGLKRILSKDVMHESESWTDFCGEISVVVLDIERKIFKDLVGEIVIGEAAVLQAKLGRRCRQLFRK
ncbi:protein LONGIFOLIA 1 [Cornus florida]|uniref:protein LONGIFOLIA 1 n=1 Tax=Cornus florida TaxID=4283 RepID=UPI00289CF3AA|nr:protein LONGIFOLIA 1 [Cornus florida]